MAKNKATSDNAQDTAEAVQDVDALEAESVVSEEAEEGGAPVVASIATKLEAAVAQAAANKESELRAYAEMQNIRRRAERDVENAHKFALEKMTTDLLVVVDNLERALDADNAASESTSALREGVEMTLESFVKTLDKFNVKQIDPEGEPFNPQEHQAMSIIDNPDVEPNTVVTVLQKGYSLYGRLIRPAMVIVSKPDATPKVDEHA